MQQYIIGIGADRSDVFIFAALVGEQMTRLQVNSCLPYQVQEVFSELK